MSNKSFELQSTHMPIDYDPEETIRVERQYSFGEDLPDEFYDDWYHERSNTYAGVFIDDDTKVKLLSVMLGRGGYFMLGGAVAASSGGHPSINSDLAENSKHKLRRQRTEIDTILVSVLEAAGVPEDERERKIHEMIEALRAAYSGGENRSSREREMRRLHRVGQIALEQAS